MTTVGAYEAKTKLPALLQRVERGETILITRRGLPVAVLKKPEEEKMSVSEVIRRMKEIQKGNFLRRKKGQTLRQLAHEGHRY